MDYVIIVAGGKGLRMHSDVPKQFMLLGSRPVLMLTMERFHDTLPDIGIVLVLPDDYRDYWQSLCRQYDFTIPHKVVSGGATRFASVSNGLRAIPEGEEGVVGIQDAVRPFVSREVIQRAYAEARLGRSVIPAMPSVESVRYVEEGKGSHALDRSRCFLVQTPQTFPLSVIRRAYSQSYQPTFTDDASVVESLGLPITLVEGNRENIKLTTDFDLILAKVLMDGKR